MVDNFFKKIQMQYILEVKDLIEEVKKIDSVTANSLCNP